MAGRIRQPGQSGTARGMKEREMVFDFLRKAPVEAVPERKASAVGRVIAWGNAGRVAWSPRDTAPGDSTWMTRSTPQA